MGGRDTVSNAFDRANVRLSQNEVQKFLQKMQSDPKFAQKLREQVRAGNESQVAELLKKNGFKLG